MKARGSRRDLQLGELALIEKRLGRVIRFLAGPFCTTEESRRTLLDVQERLETERLQLQLRMSIEDGLAGIREDVERLDRNHLRLEP